MATVTKREWKTSKGKARQAWVLAYTDPQGKRHKEQFETKKEAEAREEKVKEQFSKGTFRADAKTKTVSDACENYLEWLDLRHKNNQRVTETYLVTNQGEIWNYIAPNLKPDDHQPSNRVTPFPASDTIGHCKLAQFTSADVLAFSERLLGAGMSVTMTKRVIATLGRALKRGIAKNWIAVNATTGVEIIEPDTHGEDDEGNGRVVPPSKSNLETLLKAARAAETALAAMAREADDSQLATLDAVDLPGTLDLPRLLTLLDLPDLKGLYIRLLFAATSGLRASEQWALQWGDVDLEARKVKVVRRFDYRGNVGRTKSDASVRTVPLGIATVEALKEWKRQTNQSGTDDLVFPASEGGHTWHGNFLKRTFNLFKEAVGVPGVTWHAFRHFAISTWIEAELKPKVVQTFAGHATLAITMDRYGHLFPSDDHSAAMDRVADSIAL